MDDQQRAAVRQDKWTFYHLSVFLFTFFSYAFFHASRKTLSTVKSSFIDQWLNGTEPPLFDNTADAQEFLGMLDAGFLSAYAFGLYVSGMLGDRFEPRIVLSIGMWLSAILVFLFGTVSEWLKLYSKAYYMIMWVLCGLIQSSGWPTEVAIMANWFGHNSRGAVLGLWSACASVGNIIGTLVSALFLQYGYQFPFLVNSSLLFGAGFVVFFGLHSSPRDVGLPEPTESRDEANRVIETTEARPRPIGFFRAWLLPGVLSYAFAYACLKLVNYGFFFWLPLYLRSNFGWKESVADELSTWYDWGGILAGFLGGILTDYLDSRTPVVVTMLVLAMGALLGYSKSPKDMTTNAILMTITGFFIGGPANLISAAVSADLGKCAQIRGSSEALATVTGIVDGTGSVGAALGQLIVPAIQSWFSWNAVFYMFILMTFCTCLCLVPLLWSEIRARIRVTDDYRQLATENDESTRPLINHTDIDHNSANEVAQ